MAIHEYGYYWRAEQYDFLGGITAENIGSPNFYIEYSSRAGSGQTQNYLCTQSGNSLRVGNNDTDTSIQVVGFDGIQAIPTGRSLTAGEPFTIGCDYDPLRTDAELNVYFWVNDGLGYTLAGTLPMPEFFTDFNTPNTFANAYSLISRIIVRAGGINGTETHHYNANYDRAEVGVFNVRSSATAGKIWNINPTTERGSSTSDSVFELYNGIAEVNGQPIQQTITLGDTGQTVSLPPTLTTGTLLVYGVDTPYSYDSATGLATFDAPAMGDLAGCDPIGESEISIADSEPVAITTAVPAPYDVVTLVGPIYTGETSYTFGSDFTPSVGWQHIYNKNEVIPTPDNQFSIVNETGSFSFTGYSIDPATGMQEYPVTNITNEAVYPTVNQTTLPQTVTVGDQIQVSATASDYDTFHWIADLDGTFDDENALEAVFTTAEHGQLTITAVAENAEGSRSDSVTHTVQEPIAMGEFTATHQNVPDGQIETVVVNLDTSEVLFNGMKSWANGQATFSFENLANGSRIQVSTLNETDQDGGLSVEYAA